MGARARELQVAGALHRWIRKVALAGIPAIGLCGCGNCRTSDSDRWVGRVDGGSAWAPGSQHAAAECATYCGQPVSDVCFREESAGCTVDRLSGNLVCHWHRISCSETPCGRLPAGLKSAAGWQPSSIAAELASAAHLEGAAVFAFEALERELTAHGAPRDLVARARSARQDEKRHEAVMSRLAGRFGGRLACVEVEPIPVRTLVELATENAIEGCVRETYGAAVAVLQGERAEAPSVRNALRSIALDETEHGSLGWAIDAWVRPRLPPGERAQVDGARENALARFLAEAREPVDPEVRRVLGLPDPAASAQLLAMIGTLFS